jgi:multiple sugar transport system permease protein
MEVQVKRSGERLWQRVRAGGWSYLYVAPMVLLLVAFTIYPNIASLGYTFYQWN